jgi:hypothetical protein
MTTDGIIAFKAYVEAVGKLQSIKEYMEEQTEINVLGLYPEIQIHKIKTLAEIAKEYGKNIIYADTKYEPKTYKYYASFQIRSKEHGILLTVFCYTDTEEGAEP